MVNIANLAATATRLIDANGRTVTIRKTTPPAESDPSPWDTAGTTVTSSVKAVFASDISQNSDGTLLRRPQREVWVGAVASVDVTTYVDLIDGNNAFDWIYMKANG